MIAVAVLVVGVFWVVWVWVGIYGGGWLVGVLIRVGERFPMGLFVFLLIVLFLGLVGL